MGQTFAVFGDVHGRITLMLVLARRWEVESGRSLDGILQVGDMGAFPDVTRLDRATRRHAEHDPDELGYASYRKGCAEGAALLGTPGWPVVWMRGNHEDFDHLAQFTQPTPVDPWGRLIFVPDGTIMDVGGLQIGAMGGQPCPHPRARRRPSRRGAADTDNPAWVDRRAAEVAYPDGGLDILLSHAGPAGVLRGGCAVLEALATRTQPRVHLFGHHHVCVGPLTRPGGAVTVGLDHLEFVRGRLQSRCWGILEMADDQVNWTWGDDLYWTRQMVKGSYRSWVPVLSAS